MARDFMELPALTRPPALTCALGVDVGGTKIAAGLVAADGRLIERRAAWTLPERGGDAVLADALSLAAALMSQAEALAYSVEAVGVGVCELVDAAGQVMSEHTVRWRGYPVQEQFARLAPCLVEADSRAAAFGEARCGAGQAFRSFYYVTVGTGIGGCWIVEGMPFAGATGCAGTLASSPLSVLCPECGTMRSAVLEDVASGPALLARYNRRAPVALRSTEEVLCAMIGGDALAESVVTSAVESLGSTLGLLVNVLDPEGLVIGGGLGAASGLFTDRLIPAIRRHIWSEVHRDLPILRAARGGDSGLIGAALLAWRNAPRTTSGRRTG